MQPYPHHYKARAEARSDENVQVTSPGLEELETAAPAEFGGPGDLWSPETLFVASIVDCFVLSFRAIARASKLEWNSLGCDAEAVLDKVERVTRFTEVSLCAVLEVPAGVPEDRALRLLDKAKRSCLVTNSLTAETQLRAEVRVTS